MLANVRREHFKDLRTVIFAISDDALQRVYAAEADVELGVAELVDCSRKRSVIWPDRPRR